ncbi:hypothetical protein [Micromonospora sp. KC723]|uniref:hypothetical protein n=1 Tax=Micromonospora sp. KC723 TaxID=2530381 RepID=UPI001052588F|nr:hypothetical protein [Micromonospora sp. KC723]TDB73464.1 hypothetical protein E1165_17165 [Micromonospora sp. KC723]
MSDQSPPGASEPGPVDSSGPGGKSEPPGPVVPRQSSGPDPSDGSSATEPGGSGWPAADPAGPARPEVGGAAAGQPVDPYPWHPPAPPVHTLPPGAGPYPGYPPYGGHPPYGWPAVGGNPNDPLVNPPYAGVGGWFARCAGAVRRGWPLLLPLLFLTQVLPSLTISLVTLGLSPSVEEQSLPADGSLPEGFFRDLAVLGAAVVVLALLSSLVQCVGWAGGTWVVTRQAAGEPVAFGGALRYGLRRAPGLWGWQLLVSLLVLAGSCFFLLPGVYLAFALALAGPVYLFERQSPIGRSFRFFHDRLGLVLGRVGLVALAMLLGVGIGAVLEEIATAPFGLDPLASPGSAVAVLVLVLVAGVLTLPFQLVQLVGLLATYAEQRAQEGPVDAARLAAELG